MLENQGTPPGEHGMLYSVTYHHRRCGNCTILRESMNAGESVACSGLLPNWIKCSAGVSKAEEQQEAHDRLEIQSASHYICFEDITRAMNIEGLLARSLQFCFGTVDSLSYSAKRALWQRMNRTPLADSKHRIFEYDNSQISKGQPVDYLEFGVGGGTFHFWL